MTSQQPLVTIVTITYNLVKAGRTEAIVQSLESVHNQSYENIEHIIIDGASDDGTLELLKPYEEKGWIKIYSEPDSGIYDAMNKGILKATGEYINFLNSDDYFSHPEGVKESVACLLRENADFSYATTTVLGKNDTPIALFLPSMETFYLGMPFCHQSMFTKKDVMLKFGMFDTSYKIVADYDFLIRMAMGGVKGTECYLNFVNFRTGGFSEEKDRCLKEATISRLKNFGSLAKTEYNETHAYRAEVYREIANDLLYEIMLRVHPVYKKTISSLVKEHGKQIDNLTILQYWNYWHIVRKSRDILAYEKNRNKIEKSAKRVFYLFDIIPLIVIKYKNNQTQLKLFNLIPLLSWKRKEEKLKVKLFNFIPLFKFNKK